MQIDFYINEIKDRLITNLSPQKIILFGSYAYGNPNKNSDIDMLIIADRDLPTKGRSILVERLMKGVLIPTDFLLYTSKEIEKLKYNKNHIVYEIMKRGKIIYEK